MKLFLFLLTAFLLSPSLFAQTPKCDARFRVAMNPFPPLYWRGDDGIVRGLSYDLVQELTKRTKCLLNQDPMPYPRGSTEMSQWRVDFYAFALPLNGWEEFANYDVVYKVTRLLVVGKKNFVKGKSIDDYVKDKSIKFADTIGSPMFLKDSERKLLKESGRLVELPNPEVAYDLLKTGRVQAMFSSPLINKYFMDQLKMRDKVQILRDPKNIATIGLYSSKKRVYVKQRELFQTTIKEMRDDGTIRDILSKYIDPEDIKILYRL